MQDSERRTMTRKQKAQVVDHMLDRYDRLGALLVSDNESLCRLLTTRGVGPGGPAPRLASSQSCRGASRSPATARARASTTRPSN